MKKLIEKTLEIIPLIIEEWLRFSDYKQLHSDELRNIYVAILFKTIHSFEGSIFLLYNYSNKPYFQLTYASAMRDIISDLVLVEYLSCKSLDADSNLKEIIDQIYSDHDLFMEKQLKLNKELYGKNEGYDKVEEDFLLSISKYKDENGKIKKEFKNRLGVFDNLKYINSRTKLENKNIIRNLYLWYSDLSKLAHFGKRTISVIENYFVKINDNEYYSKNYELITTVISFCVGLLEKICNGNAIDDRIYKKYEELCKIDNAN